MKCRIFSLLFLVLAVLPALGISLQKAHYVSVIRAMTFDKKGDLWIGSYGSGVWRVEGNEVKPIFSRDGTIPSRKISRFVAEETRIWAATTEAGLIYFDFLKKDWILVDPSPGTDFRRLHALLITPQEETFIGSVGTGAAVLKSGKWQIIGSKENLRDDWINDAAQVPEGVWLAGSKGLSLYSNDKIIKWKTPKSNWYSPTTWSDPEVNAVLASGSALYIATLRDGVFRIDSDGKEIKARGTKGNVQALRFYQGFLWAVGPESVWKIDVSTNEIPQATEIKGTWEPACQFKSLAVSPGNHILAGTMDGRIYDSPDGATFSLLIEYKDGKFIKH